MEVEQVLIGQLKVIQLAIDNLARNMFCEEYTVEGDIIPENVKRQDDLYTAYNSIKDTIELLEKTPKEKDIG